MLSFNLSLTLLFKLTQRVCGKPQTDVSAANSFAVLTNNSQLYFHCPHIIRQVCTEHNAEMRATEVLYVALLRNAHSPL
jgi:hypothetical protein